MSWPCVFLFFLISVKTSYFQGLDYTTRAFLFHTYKRLNYTILVHISMNTKALLPSKKILVLIGVLVVVVVGFVVINVLIDNGDADTSLVTESGPSVIVKRTKINTSDTDGDGLSDWEEQLWGSDPLVTDTDGDGTNDKEEVDSNRNPTIAYPDDDVSTITGLQGSKNQVSDDSTTSAGNFARSLISRYLSLTESGTNINSGEFDDFTSGLLNQTSNAQDGIYTESDISVLAEPEPGDIRAYGNSVGEVLTKIFDNLTETARVVQRPVSLFTKTDHSIVNSSITTGSSLVSDLIKIPVPVGVSEAHIVLSNNMSLVLTSIVRISDAESDPLAALSALTKYREGISLSDSALDALGTYMVDNGVSFSENEPGYIITNR